MQSSRARKLEPSWSPQALGGGAELEPAALLLLGHLPLSSVPVRLTIRLRLCVFRMLPSRTRSSACLSAGQGCPLPPAPGPKRPLPGHLPRPELWAWPQRKLKSSQSRGRRAGSGPKVRETAGPVPSHHGWSHQRPSSLLIPQDHLAGSGWLHLGRCQCVQLPTPGPPEAASPDVQDV